MPSKLMTLFSIAAATLVVAACGSSKKSSSSASTPAGVTTTPKHHAKKKTKKHKPPPAVPSRTYKLKLAGKNEIPKGAPKGTADAVISLRGKSLEVCYKFTGLSGFTKPTFAHIHQGGAGIAGNIVVPLSTGAAFKPAGCVKTSAALIKAIAGNPHVYYVNIHNKQYPGGAVRSQL